MNYQKKNYFVMMYIAIDYQWIHSPAPSLIKGFGSSHEYEKIFGMERFPRMGPMWREFKLVGL